MKKKASFARPGKAALLRWGGALVFLAAFLVLAYLLNRPVPGSVPSSASLMNYVPAQVVRVVQDDSRTDTWTEGRRIGTQELELKLLSGPYKGRILPATNYLGAYYNVDVQEGTRIIVHLETKGDNPYVASVYNYDRRPVMGAFALVFAALLILIGGKKGLMALAGLVFTLVSLWLILIPLIRLGLPPIAATIGIVALTAAVSLLLLNGPCVKTLCAVLGCVGGVSAAGLAAALVGYLTNLNGFNMQEAEGLILVATDQGMTISGLLVCGILISSLGAVMDVAMSIASSCHELYSLNPELAAGKLFHSGMNIGRDAMGTMANTLILAFVGSSLNMLILFRVYEYPTIELINSDLMSIELLQGLAGSMGIILTVPLVAFISAQVMTRKPKRVQ